jgi:hypothetical protein
VPFNMDVGDSIGDLYFLMRSVVSPIECAQNPSAEDCTDSEVVSNRLVATRVSMTVDSDFGGYGMCNICNKALMNSTWTKAYCNETNLGKYFCIGGRNKLDTSKVGFETVASAHESSCTRMEKEWECWRNRIVKKIGGNWWSFFNESYCDPSMPAPCAWQVNSAPSVINNTCLHDRVYTAIESYPTTVPCFAGCENGAAPRNTSDPCWIGCAFEAVLGPGAGYPNGTITGMPVATLVSAWEEAFGPNGCPQVSASAHGRSHRPRIEMGAMPSLPWMA